jgi:hypothetical protein
MKRIRKDRKEAKTAKKRIQIKFFFFCLFFFVIFASLRSLRMN